MNKKIISVFICLLFMGMIPVASGMNNHKDKIFDNNRIEDMPSPVIEVELTQDVYSYSITAVIKNVGDADATKVNWSITLDGGFILFGRVTTGRMMVIPLGENATVRSGLVIGFGIVTITITAECVEGSSDTKTWKAFIWLLYIYFI